MAAAGDLVVHRFPQSKAVDAVRWLPPVSAFDRFVAAAVHDPDAGSSAVEIHAVAPSQHDEESNKPILLPRASWPSSSRVSSLRSAKTLTKPLPLALSTFAGSLHFLFVDPIEGSVESELSVAAGGEGSFHSGPISAVDLQIDGRQCVSVGEDGRVNLTALGEAGLDSRRLHDGRGLVSYTAVRWGSPAEFATGGLGFGIQWWDQRKPGGLVSQFKGNWTRGNTSGIVHSIDIHPSRKHICIAGGSSGTVFAWDLRWQQQPMMLSGVGLSEQTQIPCESDVWEVQYDSHIQPTISSAPANILPVMICSEDGLLTVLEQGEEPIELLAEPCAINSFDIDTQNPSFGVGGNSHANATERFLHYIPRLKQTPRKSEFHRNLSHFNLESGRVVQTPSQMLGGDCSDHLA